MNNDPVSKLVDLARLSDQQADPLAAARADLDRELATLEAMQFSQAAANARAALDRPGDQSRGQAIDLSIVPLGDDRLRAMAEKFCRTPLPAGVCADPCACDPTVNDRTGTNLLSVAEAEQMLGAVLFED